jgi:glutamine phosphoribosylpyrophosphate amidotransferase
MKTFLCMLGVLLVLARAALGDVVSTTTTNQVAVFTNNQANAAWSPTAVVLSLPASTSLSVAVHRVGNGVAAKLAETSVTDADTVIWVPEAAYVFGKGSALRVTASTSNFTAQLHRRPAP